MSRIGDTFKKLGEKREKALITFITAGDPDLKFTGECILAMEKAGADIIELGIPFSDPMADGPTIQKSSERALAAGTTLSGILAMVKSIRERTLIPIVLMGYFNPVFRYGAEKFSADAAAAGVDGILLVDLPPEEAVDFKKTASAAGLDVISLLAPTSDVRRIGKVARLGSGFIYYVSVTGVTGARECIADSIAANVAEIRARSTLPVAVGFGISDPDQAARVAEISDGVVVGSAIVKLFEQFEGEELKKKITAFVALLKEGIAPVRQLPA